MAIRVVTGTVLHADGSPWVGAEVTFELRKSFVTAAAIYLAGTITEVTDEAGAISVNLGVPDDGTASYRIGISDKDKMLVFLAAGLPTTLESLAIIATQQVDQNEVQTLLDANNVLTVVTVTQDYVVLPTDDYIRCDGEFPVTLLPATGSGKAFVLKNIGSGIITLDGDEDETINGLATQTLAPFAWTTVIDIAAGTWDMFSF